MYRLQNKARYRSKVERISYPCRQRLRLFLRCFLRTELDDYATIQCKNSANNSALWVWYTVCTNVRPTDGISMPIAKRNVRLKREKDGRVQKLVETSHTGIGHQWSTRRQPSVVDQWMNTRNKLIWKWIVVDLWCQKSSAGIAAGDLPHWLIRLSSLDIRDTHLERLLNTNMN